MTRIEAGGLTVHVAGGADGLGGGDGPAIVLCHGFGAPGDDLVALSGALPVPPGTRWFFPEAPLTIDFGFGQTGRAWWPIDMMALQEAMLRGRRDALSTTTPDGLHEARRALAGCLEALGATHGIVRNSTLVGGFSQGSMLATELALSEGEPFAGLVVLSGTLLCRDRWEPMARAHAAGLHVLMTHGRRDPILPFAWAEDLRAVLAAAGADVTWVPHAGAHEIPRLALEGLAAFAKATLG